MHTLTSAGAKTQLFPNFLAWTSPSELGRSRSTTVAPCPTSRSAVARPRPEAPPVIRATRPCEKNTVKWLHRTNHPNSCKGGSWLLLRCNPGVSSPYQWDLLVSHPQRAHTHTPRRVDLHLPSPTATLPGLDKGDPFSQHRSLPLSSTAARSQRAQRSRQQERTPRYLHAPTCCSHFALSSPRAWP